MGVYIKGMIMPKSCDYCRFCLEEDVMFETEFKCDLTGKFINGDYEGNFPDDCPLVELPEKHGVKPCPFCGNEVEVEKIPLWYGNGHGYKDCYEFKIRCKKCGCRVDQPENDSVYRSEEKAKKNAIKAWNRRVSDDGSGSD